MLGLGEDITNVFAGVVPVVLPATGGNGALNLLAIGGLLLAAGLLVLMTGRRRTLRVL